MNGIGIGSLLHGYVPADFFADYAGADNILDDKAAALGRGGRDRKGHRHGDVPRAEAV